MNRRTALKSIGAVGVAGALPGALPTNWPTNWPAHRSSADDPIGPDRLYADVRQYVALGQHRTATPTDHKTADWLAESLQKSGFSVDYQSFTARQYLVDESFLRVQHQQIPAFPQWWSSGKTTQIETAPLVAYDAATPTYAGNIVLVRFPKDPATAIGAYHNKLIGELAQKQAVAVIAITDGPTGGIILHNVKADAPAWPLNVLLAGPADEPALQAAIRQKIPVTFHLKSRYNPTATARNVIGKRDRGSKNLLVVSSPMSGWFTCGGERGPGVALFLGLARYVAAQNIDANCLFVSTSGHEIGQTGMHHFMQELAPKSEAVTLWTHLGSANATYRWDDTPTGPVKTSQADPNRYLLFNEGLKPVVERAYAGLSFIQYPVSATNKPFGEVANVAAQGYPRFMGMAGGHRFHHVPTDGADNTGGAILAPVARAILSVWAQVLGG